MAVIRMNLYSQMLGMQTDVTVCLPTAHSSDSAEFYRPGMKYQVLWLLHGGGGDASDYLHFTNIARYADEAKVAVVMPADYNAFYTDRVKAKYFSYIARELPRVLRTLFPLSAAREDNFVGGLSMGGFGAFKTAVAFPENFAAALVMSGGARGPGAARSDTPATPWMELTKDTGKVIPDAWDDPWNYAKAQVDAGKVMPKFFFTVGSLDEAALIDNRSTAKRMESLGCTVQFEEVAGYRHEWPFWDLSLKKALESWLPLRRAVIDPPQNDAE
ncbi:MAG: alpha/beta hydrolase-fold protein [Eubacteriales bacterium]|nr:alpha/beta hydrolase-fold protein [Eubacteriales bacterium]